MKKLITTLVLVAMLLTTLGITAAAESYMEDSPCDVVVDVKKADPAVVVKDGVIDLEGGEYVKTDVPATKLSKNFGTANMYMPADAMSKTMEYYFSWDETHGFNFAVKYLAKGTVEDVTYDGYYTNIPAGFASNDPAIPQDNFLCNVGLNFVSGGTNEETGLSYLYYAIGKNMNDGTYLNGHWGQLGRSGAYSPVGGQDFAVTYPGDGSVIYEWSVPFSELLDVAPADGVTFEFALTASAGSSTTEDESIYANAWTVALGQGGFMVASNPENKMAVAVLSDSPIKASAVVDTTTPDTTTPDTTTPDTTVGDTTTAGQTTQPITPATTRIETSYVEHEVVVTNEIGEAVTKDDGSVVTEIVTEIVSNVITDAPTESAGQGSSSPVTGDPMIIAAVVAAISACGVVVAKKRK